MKGETKAPIHSIAVGLLAVAVIVLALKEPHCNCKDNPSAVEKTRHQQTTAPGRSRTRIQRELGQF